MKTDVMSMATGGARGQAAMVVSAMVLAIAAAWSGTAGAQPGPTQGAERMEMRHGPHGMHRMHGGGGDFGGGSGMFRGSPERIERHVDRMLDGLNATDAQRAEIKRIARQAATDLQALRAQGRASREAAMGAFTAPTVDPQAFERARQQRLAQHDAASKRMTQAMVDAARVLTPEQRAKIGARLADMRSRMEDRMRRGEREGRFGPGGPGPRGAMPPAPPAPPAAPSQPRS